MDIVNINQAIRRAEKPFVLIELAAVGEIVLHGYICLGAVNWHRHLDHDEGFLVLDGAMALETEWGSVMLHAGELAVVPKGIAHRSGSQLRTTVTLMHARGLPDRKNGHRRLFGIAGEGQVDKVQLHELAAQADPFFLDPVANIDDYTLQLVTGNGLSPEYINQHSDIIWLMLHGQARLEIQDASVELAQAELVVAPRGALCRWLSQGPAVLLWLGLTESSIAEWGS